MSSVTAPTESDYGSLAAESDYGSDFDENDETTLTQLVNFAETGHAEQHWLQPVLPETLEPDDRAPVAYTRPSPRSSQQTTAPWTAELPERGTTNEEIDLFGATYLHCKHGSTFTKVSLTDD